VHNVDAYIAKCNREGKRAIYLGRANNHGYLPDIK